MTQQLDSRPHPRYTAGKKRRFLCRGQVKNMLDKNLYRTIPGLPLPVPPIFLGTAMAPLMQCGEGSSALLDRVFASGVTAFDTARSYGQAEETLGAWMESRGCRSDVTVLTKCGDIRNGVVKVDRQVITEQMSRSLDALRTGCIDIFLLHRDDPDTPVEEFIDTLNEAKNAGLIRVFGVSNWSHLRIAKANRYAAEKGLSGFSVSSPNYSLALQLKDLWGGGCITLSGPENADARAWYRKNRMPVIAYSGLGRGFCSGRFRAGDYEAARRILDSYACDGFLYPENMERLRRAEILAEQKGLTVPEIAMRYLFGSGMNLFAVVSTSSPERLEMNLRAAACPLTEAETAFLEGTEETRDGSPSP